MATLTLKLPFFDQRTQDRIAGKNEDPLLDLEEASRGRNISSTCISLLRAMLAKDPKKRLTID